VSCNIFLARSTPADFNATVRSAVETDNNPELPEQIAELESVRFFGAPESRADTFEKMTAGDLVAFHQDGEYVGVGSIGTTFQDDNKWATTTVWNDTSTPLIYTVADFIPISVPSAAVNRIFGYADGYSPPALMRVASNRVTNRPEAIKHALRQYTAKHS
jgi:hypothetical protein